MWLKNTELPYCSTVAQATDDVHRVSDPFEDWFNNCIEIDRNSSVPNSDAYDHYKQYVESLDQSPLTIKKWAQRMAQKRVPVVRMRINGKLIRCRTGIKLIQTDN
jgi:phage/plasmid-associated DNA primase